MRKQDYLCHLIHSLSPNEKRYFKLYSRLQPGAKSYMKLYDLLEGDLVYDVSQLTKKLKISSKKLADEKDYLQQVLMRALRHFPDETTDTIELHQAIIDAHILYNKKQYDYALSVVRRALPLAEAAGRHDILLSLTRIERDVMTKMYLHYTDHDQFEPLVERALHHARSEENLATYQGLRDRMVGIYHRKSYWSDLVFEKEIKAIMAHPYLHDESLAQTFAARLAYHSIRFIYHMSRAEWADSVQAAEQTVALIEQHPAGIRMHIDPYYVGLNNLMTAYGQMDRLRDVLTTVEKMEGLLHIKGVKISRTLRDDIYAVALAKRMSIYIALREYQQTISFFESSQKDIDGGKVELNIIVSHLRHTWVAMAYLHTRRYDRALHHIRIFIDMVTSIQKEDHMLYGHMLYIMIHYEMGNYQLLPHLIQSVRRLASSRTIGGRSVTLFLQLFTKLAKAPGAKEAKALIREYKPRLGEMAKIPKENVIIEAITLMEWMEGKA